MLGYLGPEGTFSQQAALEWAHGAEQLREYPTIASAIKAVDTGEIERSIVPIENSLNGSVTSTLDTLAFDANVYITGEHILRITQNLAVRPGVRLEDIKTVVSHPQALGQCSKMLERELPRVTQKAVPSTAYAARYAAESDGTAAAIAPRAAAEMYGLDIVRPACNDDGNNFTRFVIIEKERGYTVTDADKSSIVFSTEHKPGSLYGALGFFADGKINLLKIESRPMKNELGKYIFFIDIAGNADDANVYFTLDNIRSHSVFYKFLGSYPIVNAND